MNTPETLTSFSRSSGCGCKIAPSILQEIIGDSDINTLFPNLLVGNNTNDDAAVMQISDELSIISTTDFFTPIVDDAFDFGRIAASNAISDVYAMGGKPIMAIAILGWPIDKLPVSMANAVLEGARFICKEAGIPLSGGHSIDAPEPFFGLSVNGVIHPNSIKKNNTAQKDDLLFLTKPIGVGILSAAMKKALIQKEEAETMITQMTTLNKFGQILGEKKCVTAMTDVTGFGLLGHVMEMATGSHLSVRLNYSSIPILQASKSYAAQRVVPDATFRNWNSYQKNTVFEQGVNVMEAFQLLPDPQTNGGLLFSVHPAHLSEIQSLMKEHGLQDFIQPIGQFTEEKEKKVYIFP